LEAKLEKLAEQYGVANLVTFHGARTQDEIRTLLRDSDVLCLPSVTAYNGDAEGLGMVVLEAAASGVPVVATRHGGIVEAVRDGETGLLVDERDGEALGHALERLRSNVSMREYMGRRGRDLVEKDFDVVKQTASLERVYFEVLEEHNLRKNATAAPIHTRINDRCVRGVKS